MTGREGDDVPYPTRSLCHTADTIVGLRGRWPTASSVGRRGGVHRYLRRQERHPIEQRVHEGLIACTELISLLTPWSVDRNQVWSEMAGAWALQKPAMPGIFVAHARADRAFAHELGRLMEQRGASTPTGYRAGSDCHPDRNGIARGAGAAAARSRRRRRACHAETGSHRLA